MKRIAVTVWSLATNCGMSLAIGPPTKVEAAIAAGAKTASAEECDDERERQAVTR